MKRRCSTLKVKVEDVTNRVDNLLEELRAARKQAWKMVVFVELFPSRFSVLTPQALKIHCFDATRLKKEDMIVTNSITYCSLGVGYGQRKLVNNEEGIAEEKNDSVNSFLFFLTYFYLHLLSS
ncbi:alanine--tRNA ligase, chloroplastic/mitochondrial-like [Eutrema salsugineum]|uniref:alanine--tRNA ligase, chloroplastic/mitochondrial-like n=1 Tax=Eutrema salsugineum TaxID=72664 RepID=UPI000CED2767|nr:alanine--tRNA ligase, chloroplastic/mitochondrial-like [Eutrema salsugineum]XP_024008885.1 alanine--tRNA ligase, chloroplastic/mitochondrial-like [Eutrema salsugineum]